MNRKKSVWVVLVMVIAVFMVLSASTALAGNDGHKTAPTPVPNEHAPVCYKVESPNSRILELSCYDSGKDIIDVQIKSDSRYELIWDSESVTFIVYPVNRTAFASWYVRDKAGSEVTGTLP